MNSIPIAYDNNVLVGLDTSDDAGVYRISDDVALVQTVDFFSPIVDDPFTFGRIAAVNALSDVYAMGGLPLTAMNIVAFPLKKFTLDILSDILKGGLAVLDEAEVQLLGGHSVEDTELKYGLSVTGKVHPDNIIRNHGMKPGDKLILTKPLGTGVISTAIKADMLEAHMYKHFINAMTELNAAASICMKELNVHACTDVTGFGLVGHLKEMISEENLNVCLYSSELPLLPGFRENADLGMVPAGMYRNREFVGNFCSIDQGVPRYIKDALFDPQTSGGLLVSMDESSALQYLDKLKEKELKDVQIIGEVRESTLPGISVIP